jgi:5,5'-dehydrodivanillate O-demethylase
MVTQVENEYMTRIGPGTPAGNLLRLYWHPVCPAVELSAEKPKRRIRMLGEDLVLFRDGKGRVGLIPEQCPHRRASLYYGFVEDEGIRCPYHGWKFDTARKCIEQPFEPKDSPLKNDVRPTEYVIEKLAGIYWAYMGPKPVPQLPRWEAAVATEGKRRIQVLPDIAANWLQVMENSVDTTHTHFLHARMMTELGMPERGAYYARPIEAYDFEVVQEEVWAGVRKIRTYGGDNGEKELGHPLIFPLILLAPQEESLVMHFRVPIDDTHTRIIRIHYTPGTDTKGMDWENPPVEYGPRFRDETGEYDLRTFAAQDGMAWETEGPIHDRSKELLGTSDRGLTFYRRMLVEQIKAVEAGKEPIGRIHDAAKNHEIVIKVSEGQARMARDMKQAV